METYLTTWHTVYVVIFLHKMTGNGLIILSIISYKCLRRRLHIFIGTLEVSDLSVGLLLIPLDLIEDLLGFNGN